MPSVIGNSGGVVIMEHGKEASTCFNVFAVKCVCCAFDRLIGVGHITPLGRASQIAPYVTTEGRTPKHRMGHESMHAYCEICLHLFKTFVWCIFT